MLNTETMTRAEALLWLAGLEKECPCHECHGNPVVDTYFCQGRQLCCAGTGKVPVLDLRERCYGEYLCSDPRCDYSNCEHNCDLGIHTAKCCQGLGWFPKQGRDALYDAMHKDGWDWEASQQTGDTAAWTRFEKHPDTMMVPDRDILLAYGEDSDPWLAAAKAMKAAGY